MKAALEYIAEDMAIESADDILKLQGDLKSVVFLTSLLNAAAEIEHSLMVQYLVRGLLNW